jgi:DNA-binding NtrC family response regulator
MADPIPSVSDEHETRIFYLVSEPSRHLGVALQKLLQGCEVPPIHLELKRFGSSASSRFTQSIRTRLSRFDPHLVLLALDSGNLKLADKLIRAANLHPQRPVVVVMETGKPEELIGLLKSGVTDFIVPPLRKIDVLPRLWRLLQPKNPDDTLTQRLKAKTGLKQLVGKDPVFLAEIEKIPIVAACEASVLIVGETGTGKELCARAIHYLSPRSGKPLVPFNCGAIPAELMENELFGHARGAFTGAFTSQSGLIREANQGTLFLDDVECLPLLSQAKLLRFLQEKEYRQLGCPKLYQADVRVIAATNADLEEAVREGKLRRDLYYRLNIIPLRLPALRDRRADIPLLAQHFLKKYAAEFNKQVTGFTPPVMQALMSYDWPGNVREIECVVERAILFSKEAMVKEVDIAIPQQKVSPCYPPFKEAKADVINQFERNYIQGLLLANQGNITKAARAAQKNRRAFWQLMRKHQIDVQSFKHG